MSYTKDQHLKQKSEIHYTCLIFKGGSTFYRYSQSVLIIRFNTHGSRWW